MKREVDRVKEERKEDREIDGGFWGEREKGKKRKSEKG